VDPNSQQIRIAAGSDQRYGSDKVIPLYPISCLFKTATLQIKLCKTVTSMKTDLIIIKIYEPIRKITITITITGTVRVYLVNEA